MLSSTVVIGSWNFKVSANDFDFFFLFSKKMDLDAFLHYENMLV